MQRTILSVALMVLIGMPAAFAQGGTSTMPKSNPSAGGVPEAPIGHRQPRRSDVPEKNQNDPNDPLSKENAALDRKIKSICRGC
ncbi:hypothetical protein [Bradyrhizobium sp. LMTR 3]|uniref:hypothetical protein n=1 Tax=Bradyrhizobium sp. LMTR 3 TaxID=189873 RepID=UPI00081040CB|nr:hypothetical protein [Bradyrhizobium sp. LMTR 3]OCK59343.1 hypothetical protein LMTR3_16700 [Bradyrhizobium sp. LMTR 3]